MHSRTPATRRAYCLGEATLSDIPACFAAGWWCTFEWPQRVGSRRWTRPLWAGTSAQTLPLASEECANAQTLFVFAIAQRRGARWWAQQDSNLQPTRYERAALTVELWARNIDAVAAASPSLLYYFSRLLRQEQPMPRGEARTPAPIEAATNTVIDENPRDPRSRTDAIGVNGM